MEGVSNCVPTVMAATDVTVVLATNCHLTGLLVMVTVLLANFHKLFTIPP